jgi:hypothetical protein
MSQTDTITAYPVDYRELWEEAARAALIWRKKYEDLFEAIGGYRLWEPGRRGYAAARRELERAWLGEDVDE